jgi:hypothetical protein
VTTSGSLSFHNDLCDKFMLLMFFSSQSVRPTIWLPPLRQFFLKENGRGPILINYIKEENQSNLKGRSREVENESELKEKKHGE